MKYLTKFFYTVLFLLQKFRDNKRWTFFYVHMYSFFIYVFIFFFEKISWKRWLFIILQVTIISCLLNILWNRWILGCFFFPVKISCKNFVKTLIVLYKFLLFSANISWKCCIVFYSFFFSKNSVKTQMNWLH